MKNYATSLKNAVELVDKEYNSTIQQSRVKKYLNILHVGDFVGEKTDATAPFRRDTKL